MPRLQPRVCHFLFVRVAQCACIGFWDLDLSLLVSRIGMDNRRVSSRSRSRSLSRPFERHVRLSSHAALQRRAAAGIQPAHRGMAPSSSRQLYTPPSGAPGNPLDLLARAPIKGRGKCKDKGKGKGQPKGPRKGWPMNAFTKNSGFLNLHKQHFDWIFDIDVHEHSLWLVPLASLHNRCHNPVYAHAPAEGAVPKEIVHDLSNSPDFEGIMAIGSLQVGTVSNREFIYAKVILSTGEEGYINVAMRDFSNLTGKWTLYLLVQAVTKLTKKRSYWAFEFKEFLDMILFFCDPNPFAQYNQIACCNRASNIAWRLMHYREVRNKLTVFIKFFKWYSTKYWSRADYWLLEDGEDDLLEMADVIGMDAYEIWNQA